MCFNEVIGLYAGRSRRPRYSLFFPWCIWVRARATCGGSTEDYSCGKKIWRSAQNQPQLGIRRPSNASTHSVKPRGKLSLVLGIRQTIRRYQGGQLYSPHTAREAQNLQPGEGSLWCWPAEGTRGVTCMEPISDTFLQPGEGWSLGSSVTKS